MNTPACTSYIHLICASLSNKVSHDNKLMMHLQVTSRPCYSVIICHHHEVAHSNAKQHSKEEI